MTRLMVCHVCRGILFHGAPGTGKTLVARALAGACRHTNSTPVTLFARKGADCLGKFAGEAERTLRLLFDEVCTQPPSRQHTHRQLLLLVMLSTASTLNLSCTHCQEVQICLACWCVVLNVPGQIVCHDTASYHAQCKRASA